MNDLIGFFDSGVGGISVLHTAHTLLPNENFLYYGDNGNAPYGPRPLEEIRELSKRAIDHLLERGVKAIVIACNTVTSAYAEILRSELDMPIIGMEPAIKPAQLARHGGEVIALATKATLSLPKFQHLMENYGEAVVPVVGEGLVELVESGHANTREADEAIQHLLAPYKDRAIDSIVLGCTHYPFLISSIRKCFPDIPIFDGRDGTAARLKSLLQLHRLESDSSRGIIEFQTSGDSGTIELMKRLMASLDNSPVSE